MTPSPKSAAYYSGRIYRIIWGVSGFLLTILGIYIVFYGVVDLLIRIVAGALITVLGVNAVWSAIQSKQSWLAVLVLFIP